MWKFSLLELSTICVCVCGCFLSVHFVISHVSFTCIPNDQLKTLVKLVRFDVLAYEVLYSIRYSLLRFSPSFFSCCVSVSLILFITCYLFNCNRFWQIDFSRHYPFWRNFQSVLYNLVIWFKESNASTDMNGFDFAPKQEKCCFKEQLHWK